MIEKNRKINIITSKTKKNDNLLTISCFLIVFFVAFVAITTFLFVLSCFFNVYNSFFVDDDLKSSTNMFAFIFAKTS